MSPLATPRSAIIRLLSEGVLLVMLHFGVTLVLCAGEFAVPLTVAAIVGVGVAFSAVYTLVRATPLYRTATRTRDDESALH